MTNKTFRFREYGVTTDETAMPAYQAVCVTGEDADCGADSQDQPDEEALTKWMAEHTRDTGHRRFRAAPWVYVMVEAGSWQ
ncbi:hypothetical protein OHS71_41185 (plasmid) [Streptomyces sp. NBC_00377]|uniref:DUF7848 domain-containing protein n=1 Tax=unclassified Streptomyces TaxID=2593676 RepID=UPI002E1B83E9|nr:MULTISPECIES: hypothetical protein [unclassified Streptomyces]